MCAGPAMCPPVLLILTFLAVNIPAVSQADDSVKGRILDSWKSLRDGLLYCTVINIEHGHSLRDGLLYSYKYRAWALAFFLVFATLSRYFKSIRMINCFSSLFRPLSL